MTTVTGTITGPDGNAPAAAADRKVTVTLVDLTGRARAGYTADDHEIVAPTEVTAAADGSWSVTLLGNDAVTSDWGDTLYRVDEGYDPQLRRPYSSHISVPASGSYWVGDLRTTPPGGATQLLQGYLTLSGGTLTGPLVLAGDPVTPLGAATKQYVDNHSTGGSAAVTSVDGQTGAVDLSGVYLAQSKRGAANGVASLDGSTLVPSAQIPALDASKISTGTLDTARIPSLDASKIGTGTLAAARIPDLSATYLTAAQRGAASGVASLDGTTKLPSAQVPDLSTTYLAQAGSNNPQVTSSSQPRGFGRVDLNYTATASTNDALSFYYGGAAGVGGVRTGYHNEYGELRARPALQSTVALRAMAHGSGSSGDVMQVANSDASTVYLGVSQTGAAFTVPVTISGANVATDHGYSPTDYGLVGWVGDPAYLAGSLTTAAGVIHLLKVKLPKAVTISNIAHRQSGGSITLTAGQNFAALYDTSGNRVAVTADQSTNWATAGYKTSPLTAPYSAPAGFVYVALLFNGTTPPNIPRYSTSSFFNNAGLAAADLRFAQSGAAATSMPATITMGSLVEDATAAFWAGVS